MDGFQDSLKLAFSAENSGAEEARTPNLGIANAALSQLSYIPTCQAYVEPSTIIGEKRQVANVLYSFR